jgi:hypothetical protein
LNIDFPFCWFARGASRSFVSLAAFQVLGFAYALLHGLCSGSLPVSGRHALVPRGRTSWGAGRIAADFPREADFLPKINEIEISCAAKMHDGRSGKKRRIRFA